MDATDDPELPLPETGEIPTPDEPVWREFAAAPLVPVALMVTIGLLLDRYGELSLAVELTLGGFALVGGWVARCTSDTAVWPFVGLGLISLAAAHHHTFRNTIPADDILHQIGPEPHLIRLRGIVLEEPVTRKAESTAFGAVDRDVTRLRVSAVFHPDNHWQPASGQVSLSVEREDGGPVGVVAGGIHAGDAVEVVGIVVRIRPPANPGERDLTRQAQDQRIRANVRVSDTTTAITRLEASADWPLALLARVRGWATNTLNAALPPREAVVARALLLGDTAAMSRAEWDGYIRTGVVHALAISGQHLVVLAGFVWIAFRVVGVRRTQGAWVVLVLILGYTVLTGMRPSGVRAAVMVTVVCGGLILRRPVFAANAFALAWIIVAAFNPTDPFTLGCQLSFLSVFVLVWLIGRWFRPGRRSPFDELVDETRPLLVKVARDLIRMIGMMYLITLILTLAHTPLLATDHHLVSPVGVLIGPPVIVLTSVALLSGFLMLLTAPIGLLVPLFGVVTESALALTGHLVRWAEAIPGGAIDTVGPPGWWLFGFYGGVATVILGERRYRLRLLAALAGWLLIGIAQPGNPPKPGEVRITFLAVGKGGCTVIETADGRCLLYDAGSTTGTAVVRGVIAPYLWYRGITRIDELFLSHADADHFNGLGELLRRFRVKQVTMTPSFADKPTAEVASALLALRETGTPFRVAVAGDRIRAGEVILEVLHPPSRGPSGSENERSLVMLLRHGANTVLLTGDLEKAGTTRLLGIPPQRVDVLMAPHHGSRAALPPGLLNWSEPKLILVSRGRPLNNSIHRQNVGPDATLWDTWSSGAITLRSSTDGLIAEAFRRGEVLVVKRRE